MGRSPQLPSLRLVGSAANKVRCYASSILAKDRWHSHIAVVRYLPLVVIVVAVLPLPACKTAADELPAASLMGDQRPVGALDPIIGRTFRGWALDGGYSFQGQLSIGSGTGPRRMSTNQERVRGGVQSHSALPGCRSRPGCAAGREC